MIDACLNTINLIKFFAYYVILWSFKIGQFLVGIIIYLWNNTSHLWIGVVDILKILYEDFIIFIWDIGDKIKLLSSIILSYFEITFTSIITVKNGIESTFQFFQAAILGINEGLATLLYFMKYTLYQFCNGLLYSFDLIGSGFLSFLGLGPALVFYIPFKICELFSRLIRYIKSTNVSIFMGILSLCKDFKQFLLDVPITAAFGLLFTIGIVYIVWKYYKTVNAYLYYKFSCLKRENIISKLNVLYRQYIRKKSEQKIDVLPNNNYEDNELELELLNCCVCHEKPKCILILPCRHLCVCTECNYRLRVISKPPKCPVCRTRIRSTMKVYM